MNIEERIELLEEKMTLVVKALSTIQTMMDSIVNIQGELIK